MTNVRRILLASLALPLSLAGCNNAETATKAEGQPVAKVAAPAGTQWVDKVQRTASDGFLIGNPDAPIKLVEYASLTCGACAHFSENGMEELKSEYVNSGRVSLDMRNMILNGPDLVLARIVRCSTPESVPPLAQQIWANLGQLLDGVQKKAPAMEAAMAQPENQRFVAVADAVGFLDFFAARGISRDQASECLSDAASVTAIAERSQAQAKEFDIQGTPTFLINGQKVDGSQWTELEPALQRAGAR